MNRIVSQLLGLLLQALFAWLIWRYYKDRQYTSAHKYDTFGPRFWTGTVDACVMWPVGFILTLLLLLDLPASVMAVLMVAENVAWLVYTVAMHAQYGQTVGKMACRIKVVDFATEAPISRRQAILREGIPILVAVGIVGYQVFAITSGKYTEEELVRGAYAMTPTFWVLAAFPLIWFLAEVITMLTNEKRRALHDLIAGTVVVRTNANGEGWR